MSATLDSALRLGAAPQAHIDDVIERLGSWLDALSLHRHPTSGTSDNWQAFWRFAAHVLACDRGSDNLAVLLGVNMATLQPALRPPEEPAGRVLRLATVCYATQSPAGSERSHEVVECGGGSSSVSWVVRR